ncbi:methyltransferase family protein [Smaragdicoccus niigatensis]|uniref:methyltransferase family protein n=1 Tax=Smaragdicoccus niigatensis TaxID=359359 RepID=UPI00039BB9ED|nr:isoprenylcysteine carboxylmethyltransferase family protein [Smaragdicoccus niigatensis]
MHFSLVVLQLVVLITLVGWLVIELRQGRQRRADARNADAGSYRVVKIFGIAGLLGAVAASRLVPAAAIHPQAVPATIGLVILWAGIALRLWCFRALGRYFTFRVQTSPDQGVVSTGPYRVLRHPSYAAILLVLIGIGLLYANWLSLALIVGVSFIGTLNRIRVEERELERDLGDRYREFAATRKRIIPFVW